MSSTITSTITQTSTRKTIQFSPNKEDKVVVNSSKKTSKHNHDEDNTQQELNEQDNKLKLIQYLNTEQPIVKKRFQIDSDEIRLCDELSGQVIELEKLMRMPESKVKDKLWRIPYHFREDYGGDGEGPISRFGEGVKDGCNVLLSLPSIAKPAGFKKTKDWSELLFEADEALELFEHAKWSRRTQTRRGSILQPRNVFLAPNPEVECSDALYTNGFRLPMREWMSEMHLTSGDDSLTLLDQSYKHNICDNVSLCDLDQMHCPDLKPNLSSNNNPLINSELKYLQTVRSKRRQSLVPPNFGGQSDLQFRRKSYGNGEQLWSAKVENLRKRTIYHNKIKLICPNFDVDNVLNREASELELTTEMNRVESANNMDICEYPCFDYQSSEQALLFANELTLIARQHLVSIKESEIVYFMTRPGPSALNCCSNIKSLLHFRVRLIRLIATYILLQEDCDCRARSILFFLRVIRKLYRLSNWNSINLIIQSLQCPAVVRLKNTWRRLTFQYPDDFCYFIKISEDLERKQQVRLYEQSVHCVTIFDDLIDAIKERCGFKMVQIWQHRLHKNWDLLKQDNNYVMWVSDEIREIMRDIEQHQQQQQPQQQPQQHEQEDHRSKVKSNNGHHEKNHNSQHDHHKNVLQINGNGIQDQQQHKSCLKKTTKVDSQNEKIVQKKQISFDVEDDDGEHFEDNEDKDNDEKNKLSTQKTNKKFKINLLFHRLLHCPLINRKKCKSTDRSTSKDKSSSLKKVDQNGNNIAPKYRSDKDEEEGEEAEEEGEVEYDNNLTVDLNRGQQQRGLLSSLGQHGVNGGTQINTPSCVKFWSIIELNKLRTEDREQVKQEMVRTLVTFQKKAFYVFEQRDPNTRHFLLNANCDTMDASMQRSRMIECYNKLAIKRNGTIESKDEEIENNDNEEEDTEEEETEEEEDKNEQLSNAKRYLSQVKHRQSIIMIDADNHLDCDQIEEHEVTRHKRRSKPKKDEKEKEDAISNDDGLVMKSLTSNGQTDDVQVDQQQQDDAQTEIDQTIHLKRVLFAVN